MPIKFGVQNYHCRDFSVIVIILHIELFAKDKFNEHLFFLEKSKVLYIFIGVK